MPAPRLVWFRRDLRDIDNAALAAALASAAATAEGPSTAVSTWNDSARRRVATEDKIVGSSSTTRIRFTLSDCKRGLWGLPAVIVKKLCRSGTPKNTASRSESHARCT